MAIAWSPNNMKLAICDYDRYVYLFDETGEKKDRFPTKAADSKVRAFGSRPPADMELPMYTVQPDFTCRIRAKAIQ